MQMTKLSDDTYRVFDKVPVGQFAPTLCEVIVCGLLLNVDKPNQFNLWAIRDDP